MHLTPAEITQRDFLAQPRPPGAVARGEVRALEPILDRFTRSNRADPRPPTREPGCRSVMPDPVVRLIPRTFLHDGVS